MNLRINPTKTPPSVAELRDLKVTSIMRARTCAFVLATLLAIWLAVAVLDSSGRFGWVGVTAFGCWVISLFIWRDEALDRQVFEPMAKNHCAEILDLCLLSEVVATYVKEATAERELTVLEFGVLRIFASAEQSEMAYRSLYFGRTT